MKLAVPHSRARYTIHSYVVRTFTVTPSAMNFDIRRWTGPWQADSWSSLSFPRKLRSESHTNESSMLFIKLWSFAQITDHIDQVFLLNGDD
jgi:hypothetical protein